VYCKSYPGNRIERKKRFEIYYALRDVHLMQDPSDNQ
jgi:hypothetical protein